jgi:hypothetical protein
MRSDLIDLSLFLEHETEQAILVHDGDDKKKAVWLPKSACEVERDIMRPRLITVTLPERLAIEKGLV